MAATLAIPQALTGYIDQQVASGGYCKRSACVRDLAREDEREQCEARLRALIEEGLASGPPTTLAIADWAELSDIASGTIL